MNNNNNHKTRHTQTTAFLKVRTPARDCFAFFEGHHGEVHAGLQKMQTCSRAGVRTLRACFVHHATWFACFVQHATWFACFVQHASLRQNQARDNLTVLPCRVPGMGVGALELERSILDWRRGASTVWGSFLFSKSSPLVHVYNLPPPCAMNPAQTAN